MPTYFGLEVNSDKFFAYSTEDLVFKVQARNIVVERLGFEPPIELSVLGELCIRSALKRYEQGEFSYERLKDKIDFHVQTIKATVLEYAYFGSC